MQTDIYQAISTAAAALGVPEAKFVVDHPTDTAMQADYFTNAAMVLAKPLGAAPREVAQRLLAALPEYIPHVDRVEIAGPGFINFYLTREFFTAATTDARASGDEWGKNDSWMGKTVLVEYTDPNPFKEFHVGHLFTNAVGESIARLFMMSGATTKRVNYQGDVGLHVAHAVWGMQQLGIVPGGSFSARELGQAYALGATTYKTGEETAVQAIRAINKQLYDRSNESVNVLYDAGRSVSLAYFETIYKILGTHFDAYFFESEAGPAGKALVVAHPELFSESDGARVFQGEEYGLHTRVFLNKEGLPTYEAKELALASLKAERLGEYDHSVIVTANEVNEYFKVLLCAMGLISPALAAKTEHVGHGTVRLSTGKMSSRTGEVIAAIDFIDEVAAAALQKMADTGVTEPDEALARDIAIGAIKYATLRGSIAQNSVFDKEQALSFEGDSGPYLQYTHARICSVLHKAAAAGITPDTTHAPSKPYAVERLIYQFPEVVAAALTARAPHQVAQFLTTLAGAFNTFYAHEKIADPIDEFAPYKTAVADTVRHTLKQGLWALGIKAPDKM